MKRQAMSKGLRLTLSPSEAQVFLSLAEGQSLRVNAELASLICQSIRHGLSEMAALKAKRGEAASRAKMDRIMREATTDHRRVDGYEVSATFGDYGDFSTDPDNRIWTDLMLYDVQVETNTRRGPMAPDQFEARRNVWLVHVLNPTREIEGPYFLGADCTEGSKRAEIDTVARAIIDRSRRNLR